MIRAIYKEAEMCTRQVNFYKICVHVLWNLYVYSEKLKNKMVCLKQWWLILHNMSNLFNLNWLYKKKIKIPRVIIPEMVNFTEIWNNPSSQCILKTETIFLRVTYV